MLRKEALADTSPAAPAAPAAPAPATPAAGAAAPRSELTTSVAGTATVAAVALASGDAAAEARGCADWDESAATAGRAPTYIYTREAKQCCKQSRQCYKYTNQ